MSSRGDSRLFVVPERWVPLLRFVRARLSPEGYLGLHLTVGALILIAATWLFGGIAEDVVTGDPLTDIDLLVANWLHARRNPSLSRAMALASDFGATAVITSVAAFAAVLLLCTRRWYWLLALVLTVPGGMLLNVGLKLAFQRSRPTFADPAVVLSTYSFPSGHTMAATMLYGLLAVLTVATVRAWRWRLFAGAISGVLILLVGFRFSRIYFGVHYLSDVLAATAAGIAWLTLCLTGVESLRRLRLPMPPRPSA
jgi:membrane-associated phospholipid phosphatase